MAPDYDPSEFVDEDLKTPRKAAYPGSNPAATPAAGRAPTREETESRVSETQAKLAALKRAQEELERERSQLEETRRRQVEYQTGREEMLRNLTRGIVILDESAKTARRDAESMSKTLLELIDFQAKVQTLSDQHWTKDNMSMELTKALTTIENARMEWNSALTKFPVLNAEGDPASDKTPGGRGARLDALAAADFKQLVRIGLAFTLPLVIVGAITGAALFLLVLFRR